MRSLGVARARYDYSARDRSELSLQEGDTIRILSKKGHSGWWRGEVYGRVRISEHRPAASKKYKFKMSDLYPPSVPRWDSFLPTMWKKISLITADVLLICRPGLCV